MKKVLPPRYPGKFQIDKHIFMPGIESRITLAIATKLKLIFEKDEDRFLTFPDGLAYQTDFFDFIKDPFKSTLSAQQWHNNRIEFSRITGMVPEDRPVFQLDATRMLGSIYKETLNDSDFANTGLTPAEKEELEAAFDFLTDEITVDSIVTREPSPRPEFM